MLLSNLAGLSPPRLPPSRLERANAAGRRRLDDAVEEVFQRACLSGDLETAGDLLTVLVAMHERRKAKYGHDRRISDDTIQRARLELERRVRLRSLASANPGR